MDLVDIQRVLKHIRYKGQKLKFEVVGVGFVGEIGYDIMVRLDVKERTTGEEDYVYTHYTFCPAEVPYVTPARIISKVRLMLHFLETHEADEQLLYRGRRVYDPHREKLTGPYVSREAKKMREKTLAVRQSVLKHLKEYRQKQEVTKT